MSTEPAAGLPKLAAPARRALAAAGYSSLNQLAQARADDIAALHGMGPNAMKALRQALQEHGLSFRASDDA
ncbi:DNA-binding protein [Actinomadura luteofluorescens]|uniref:Putative Fe-Mo cluster-binding NifX family protein n=1 Tax=Actinomadura luteofluorescens TaxID=46163 RepID=A0A7Y9JKF4_9ACTN|nr:DNA-binding protein [Actinomadura luteofluorescens]NYD51771.1 putative Fe-Mo cluster-binding NifX family protein [Actinomadura luteofluorescens]